MVLSCFEKQSDQSTRLCVHFLASKEVKLWQDLVHQGPTLLQFYLELLIVNTFKVSPVVTDSVFSL